MNDLRVGMTRQEAVQTMGKPWTTKGVPEGEYLIYRLADTWAGWTEEYFVAIVDGRVVAFGKTGDFGSTALPTERHEYDVNWRSR
jgi:hypothetical protein